LRMGILRAWGDPV